MAGDGQEASLVAHFTERFEECESCSVYRESENCITVELCEEHHGGASA